MGRPILVPNDFVLRIEVKNTLIYLPKDKRNITYYEIHHLLPFYT